MNDLTKKDRSTNTSLTNPNANPFEAYGNAAASRSFEGDLLRFLKGDYVAGADAENIPLGTQFKVLMDTLAVGWVYWYGGACLHHRMGLVKDGYQPERRSDLGDQDQASWERDARGQPRDPWQFTNYLTMRRIDDGKVYTFATSTKGGLNAVGELSKAYGKSRHFFAFSVFTLPMTALPTSWRRRSAARPSCAIPPS
jgi:hypothetical protein